VLFEMLSGKKAFTGETLTDTLAAVVRAEPNWNDLPTNTPPSIRQLLRRCFTKDPKQRLRDSYDIWRLDLSDTPAATPFIQTQFNERCSRLSPDGHWLACVSDESGRDEVYIQSFPQPGSKIQVSTSGGDQPVWSRHGSKLFFRGDGAIQEITFQPGSPPSVSKARSLFPDSFESPQAGSHTGYDVFPDGRFLMIQAGSQSDAASEIVVVVNWTEELKRLVPLGKD